MVLGIDNFSLQAVPITSAVPTWNGLAATTQKLNLMVGQWGSPDAPPERTYLLVHGITANLRWWNTIAQRLLAASPGPIRLIAPDLRGRGDSDKPDQPYSVVVSAADMVGLLDALGLDEPINYVGHSLGAHIGTVFASRYPRRVRRLVLIDGGARLAADVEQSIGPALRRVGRVYPDFAAYVAPLKAAGIIPGWDDEVDQIYRYDSTPVEGGLMSKVSQGAIGQELENLTAFYAEVDDYYPQITAPTLLLRAPDPIAANLSPFVPAPMVDLMRRTIAGGLEVIEVAHTNHYTILLKPTEAMIAAILGGQA